MGTPGREGIREVQRRLRADQGAFMPKPQLPVIDEVVATVLSQHTSDVNSERAFARLKERFPTWEQVADAPVAEVAEAIGKPSHPSTVSRTLTRLNLPRKKSPRTPPSKIDRT